MIPLQGTVGTAPAAALQRSPSAPAAEPGALCNGNGGGSGKSGRSSLDSSSSGAQGQNQGHEGRSEEELIAAADWQLQRAHAQLRRAAEAEVRDSPASTRDSWTPPAECCSLYSLASLPKDQFDCIPLTLRCRRGKGSGALKAERYNQIRRPPKRTCCMRRRPTGCLVPAPAQKAAMVTHRLSPVRLDAADSWCIVSPVCSCITSSGARIISAMALLAWRCVWVLSRLRC